MIGRFSEKHAAFRMMVVITVVDVLVSAGFSLAGVFTPAAILPFGQAPTAGSSLFALYAAARALPIAVFALVAIRLGLRPMLLAIGSLAGFIQFLDAAIGLMHSDMEKTIGPFIIGVLQIAAASILYRADR